jgi:hypothetical protein
MLCTFIAGHCCVHFHSHIVNNVGKDDEFSEFNFLSTYYKMYVMKVNK